MVCPVTQLHYALVILLQFLRRGVKSGIERREKNMIHMVHMVQTILLLLNKRTSSLILLPWSCVQNLRVTEPTNPVDLVIPDSIPKDTVVLGHKRRPAWVRQTLQDAEGHVAPRPYRESKKPQRYLCYIALMSSLLDSEPSTYEEACIHQCWRRCYDQGMSLF